MRSPLGDVTIDDGSGNEKLSTCSMVNGSLEGFVFATEASLAGVLVFAAGAAFVVGASFVVGPALLP
jgi:hypothetical protein